MNLKTVVCTVPSGAKAELIIPDKLTEEAVSIIFKSVLGTLVAFSLCDKEGANKFVAKYAAVQAATAEDFVRKLNQYEKIESDPGLAHIVEKLLDSIGDKSPENPNERK